MLGNRFYNQSLRKLIIAFGQVFNNIVIQRTNSTGGVTARIKVPLAYAPKEKFMVRLDQQANLNSREFATSLPRMGFEITGLNYDPSRKLTRVQKYSQVKTGEDGKKVNFNYTPVPYNINLQLYLFTATAEDGLQIVEQILPYFQPDYTVTINAIPEMGIKRDVPITLNSVNYEDTYDGSFTTRRAVNYTLGFTAKTYLYGPVYAAKVIKETTADIFTDTASGSTREERIVIVPNPTTADADDDFGFTTTITNFADSKTYNQTTDSDE